MKPENSFHIKDALQKYLQEEKIDQQFNEKKLISMWKEIMGSPIANRTSGIFIKNKVMFVKLTSAPLKQELTHARQKVLNLMEEKMGSKIVEEVRFL
ncbi:MAG: putative nucleic acid-binding Zn ribbon protein [Cyclobacteriaceae bacterium]|jgi:predicted nucleic acid-binding Zn ribbon protein